MNVNSPISRGVRGQREWVFSESFNILLQYESYHQGKVDSSKNCNYYDWSDFLSQTIQPKTIMSLVIL